MTDRYNRDDYWKVHPSPEERKQLDLDLIYELNREYEHADDEDIEIGKKGSGTGVKLVGLITALIFVAFIVANILRVISLPPLDFVLESRELSNDPLMQELQQAVVMIRLERSHGTGFNIDSDGLVVTNYHVISGHDNIHIAFPEQESFVSEKIHEFQDVDLAVIDVDGNDLPKLDLGHESSLNTGDEVTIIGYPLGFSNIIKRGEIIGQHQLSEWEIPVMLVKGSIHSGSSGSPVFDEEGRVVGVIFGTLLSGYSEDGEHVGLAVPISELKGRID